MPSKEKSYGIALLDNKNRVLTVLENSGKWGIPKGHMENCDLNYFYCMIREFKEEVNINILEFKPILLSTCGSNKTCCFLYIMKTLVDSIDIKLRIDHREIRGYEWIDLASLNKVYSANRSKYNPSVRAFMNAPIVKDLLNNKKYIPSVSFDISSVDMEIYSSVTGISSNQLSTMHSSFLAAQINIVTNNNFVGSSKKSPKIGNSSLHRPKITKCTELVAQPSSDFIDHPKSGSSPNQETLIHLSNEPILENLAIRLKQISFLQCKGSRLVKYIPFCQNY
jgi:8-oxo-dGTP pyrophosphatase MutT (NUDIX family)